MFIHIGGNVSVPKKEVIGIFDIDLIKKNNITKEFLDLSKSEAMISVVSKEQKTKSFVVTNTKVYYSPISSVTLKKRANNILDNLY